MAPLHSPPVSAGPPPVAPEQVHRLLHMIDTDGDEIIRLPDLVAFVGKAGLSGFTADKLEAMFGEANSSGDGLMDEEQLGKAVSGRFQHRRHNEAWYRLCEQTLAPAASGRITTLSPVQLVNEPILANFEQERGILTFSPRTNSAKLAGPRTSSRGGGSDQQQPPTGSYMGFGVEASATASGLYSQSAASTLSFSGTARRAPPPVHVLAADRAQEDAINRHLWPEGVRISGGGGAGGSGAGGSAAGGTATVATPGSPNPMLAPGAVGDAGAEVAALGAETTQVMRFGFGATSAMDLSLEKQKRESDGVGWRTRLSPRYAAEKKGARQSADVYYGLHAKDWRLVPSPSDSIPLRVDGSVTRTDTRFAAPSRLQACENSSHGLANSRAQAAAREATGKPLAGEFVSHFAKSLNQSLRCKAASDRLAADDYVAVPALSYLNGKPEPHSFRSPSDPAKMPPPLPHNPPLTLFVNMRAPHEPPAWVKVSKPPSAKTQLEAPKFIASGSVWPKSETGVVPPSALRASGDASLRLTATENQHPASRTGRAGGGSGMVM